MFEYEIFSKGDQHIRDLFLDQVDSRLIRPTFLDKKVFLDLYRQNYVHVLFEGEHIKTLGLVSNYRFVPGTLSDMDLVNKLLAEGVEISSVGGKPCFDYQYVDFVESFPMKKGYGRIFFDNMSKHGNISLHPRGVLLNGIIESPRRAYFKMDFSEVKFHDERYIRMFRGRSS